MGILGGNELKKVFAFVFARGGSKGLPGKNIKPLGGVPLVAHSILTAKKISKISRIFVSTESNDIKEIARAYGAEVIDRPAILASDQAAEWDAWRHAVNYLCEKGEDFDVFLSLPATSPLRSAEDVVACLKALDKETDVVISVTPASRNPYFNMVSRDSDGSCRIIMPSQGYQRRQDVPSAYDITTVAYVLRKDFILRKNSLFEGRVKSVIIPKERAVDIDDIWDFMFADKIYSEADHAS